MQSMMHEKGTSEATSLCLDCSAAFWQIFYTSSVGNNQEDMCLHVSSQLPMNAKHSITATEGWNVVLVLLQYYLQI